MLGFVVMNLNAQVPGYMGKRLNMGYGFYINPAFTAYSYGYGESRFNIQHEGFLEYATGKSLALVFRLNSASLPTSIRERLSCIPTIILQLVKQRTDLPAVIL